MQRYEYILFDWDGTIAKTLDLWMIALDESLQKRGHHFTDKEIGADYSLFRERNLYLGTSELDNVIADALELSRQRTPSVELYPDQLKVLTELHKAGKRLGIVTTSDHHLIDPLLETHGMMDLFDVVICGDDVTQQKPDAEPIHKALSLLSAEKSTSVMVGDSDKDILSARNAGIDCILFYPAEHDRFHDIDYLKSLQPTYVIKDFQEIIALTR